MKREMEFNPLIEPVVSSSPVKLQQSLFNPISPLPLQSITNFIDMRTATPQKESVSPKRIQVNYNCQLNYNFCQINQTTTTIEVVVNIKEINHFVCQLNNNKSTMFCQLNNNKPTMFCQLNNNNNNSKDTICQQNNNNFCHRKCNNININNNISIVL